MLSDFEMILHKFNNEDIEIYPVYDVHLAAAEHLKIEWENFIKFVKEKPNRYLLLGGDLINNATKSSVSNVFEETMRPREQKRVMCEYLEPLKDRILAAVSGNHERRSGKDADDDPIYDIMCKLDIENLYRENLAFVKLQFGDVNGRGQNNPTYMIAMTHGSGGGIYTGGAVNRAERFGYYIDGADCLVVGHTHKPFSTQPAKIKINPYNNTVSVKPFKVVGASSWLALGGYAAQKMLSPSALDIQVINICGSKKEIKITM